MAKPRSVQIIRIVDELGDARDLTTALLMACGDLDKCNAGPLQRLCGLVLASIKTIEARAEKLLAEEAP